MSIGDYHLTKKVNDKMRDILNKRAAMKWNGSACETLKHSLRMT